VADKKTTLDDPFKDDGDVDQQLSDIVDAVLAEEEQPMDEDAPPAPEDPADIPVAKPELEMDIAVATTEEDSDAPEVDVLQAEPESEYEPEEPDFEPPNDLKVVAMYLKKIYSDLVKLSGGVPGYDGYANDTQTSQPSWDLRTTVKLIGKALDAIESRQKLDDMRAAYRHEVIFNALKKMSEDINEIRAHPKEQAQPMQAKEKQKNSTPSKLQLNSDNTVTTPVRGPKGKLVVSDDAEGHGTSDDEATTPPKKTVAPSSRSIRRKNMENCLRVFMNEMNQAKKPAMVEAKGKLCVQYSDDLFRKFI